ncbi:endonuclease/exonuclease/phosphatase family protein [Micromonospora krabiensis]|uniref:Metal-dependent hydrolase, endonuclease/exonuclease/phosphatase family n=1 Tax=Micromonospora krabiensis TaxID=307121 RepID=A0A1C3N4B5_9ACTN|nr:endonuclease/exonuclease/phosphatase family protein [Micromonospora krabiensis]SBV27417.1 Metal-dependent hydrolase, endonuclease/exonuclease/phosphatase family [Micromonospora krabiensis]
MRHRRIAAGGLALGVVLLTDVLRVWLPGIITIFGQAASTPAELMGAFALGWFVLALATPALIRRVGARRVTLVAAVLLAVLRLALTASPGGRPQLWLATAGLLAGLVWLAGAAAATDQPVPGLALGLALGAAGHAVLDTYDLVWRGDVLAWLVSAVLVLLFLATQAVRSGPPGPGGARAWLLAGPALLLAGMLALSPAVARTASSYLWGEDGVAVSPVFGLAPVPFAVAGFLLAALAPLPRRVGRLLGPVVLLTGVVLFALDRGRLLLPALLLAAVGLGFCLSTAARASDGPVAGGTATSARVSGGPGTDGTTTSDRAARRAYAATGGLLVFAVAAVAYYSAYDLGYPHSWVPVTVAGLVAAVVVTAPPDGRPVPVPLPAVRTTAVVAALALLGPLGGADEGPLDDNRGEPRPELTVVAYNIRMGFGLDGRLDLPGLERAVGPRTPDVVVLSEVDRGWLLNGGHDTLDLLADRLGLPYVFAPAADTLWGDAVLTRWPVSAPRTRPLSAVGAPTGAQALAVTLDLGEGLRVAVVSTHLQPPPGQGPVVQAREVAAFATGYAAGRPLVVAGDLNTQPGDPAFGELTRAGLVDALAAARPLATSPADDPREQIDHVFVTPDLAATGAVAPPSTASDHLPVAVTLTLPRGR